MTTVMPESKRILVEVSRYVQEGKCLADSLKQYLKPDLYYQLLLAEQHGNLITTLTEVGRLMQAQERQRKKLLTLLQYPLLLLAMLVVLIVGLVIFVFPELQSWQLSGESNRGLRLLESLGIYLVTGLIVGISINFYRWKKRSIEQRAEWLCKLPLLGKAYRYYYQYYLLSLIGMMLKRGMALQEIFSLLNRFDHQSLLYVFGQRVQRVIADEQQLSKLILKTPLLPNELIILMKKGTPVNHLGAELMAFAELRFKKLTVKIESLLTFVQPCCFILIALVIVSLYLSILLPIYQSFQGVY